MKTGILHRRRLMFTVEPVEPEPNGGAGSSSKTFTQADIDRIAAAEKDQGRRAGQNDFVKALGFDSTEALRDALNGAGIQDQAGLKTFLEQRKADADAALTEQQRRDRELSEREQRVQAQEAEAQRKALLADRKSALVDAGVVGKENLEDALALLRVADDADEAAVTAAIEALKQRRAELFSGVAAEGRTQTRRPIPNGQPAGGPPANGGTGKEAAGARGIAMAKRRFGDRVGAGSGASA